MRTHHVDIHLLSFYTRTLIEMARIRYVNVVGIFALTLEIRDLIVDAPLSVVTCSGSGCYLPAGVDSCLFAHVISKGVKI